MTADAGLATGLILVRPRRLLAASPRVVLPIEPGDRIEVAAGAVVAAGDLLAERIREPHVVDGGPAAGSPAEPPGGGRADRIAAVAAAPPQPGAWVSAGEHRRGGATPAGELLLFARGRRRVVTGSHPDRLEAPARGRVVTVRPGVAVELQVDGIGLSGSVLLGEPARGRLVLLPAEGDARPALDVNLAGAIVVFPGRVDAETLIRARAMGVHGAVVVSLSDRDRRDLAASEARQRAGLHRLAAFGVLILDGNLRRPLAGPLAALLVALSGREVGLVGEPPLLLAEGRIPDLPRPGPDRVRVLSGPDAGGEGSWLGLAGVRRFAPGVGVEAGRVLLDDGREVVAPLGELERFE